MINVGTFRCMAAEAASHINVSEVISSTRTLFSKRNLAYGFNVGNFSSIPSNGHVLDNDLIDAPVFAPTFQPAVSFGY
jgi:hypothetical protein